jgi:hypothetical protein
MPGVKVNLSKGGMSFSLGRKGFTINVGKHGVRRTVGIPGTGISNTEYISKKDSDEEAGERGKDDEEGLLGGMGTLAGMAALGALADNDADEDKPKRKPRKREESEHKTAARSTRASKKEAAGQRFLAVRGLFIFAAVAIAIYLGSVVFTRLPPTWPSDLSHLIVQWAVQFGH